MGNSNFDIKKLGTIFSNAMFHAPQTWLAWKIKKKLNNIMIFLKIMFCILTLVAPCMDARMVAGDVAYMLDSAPTRIVLG